jgi:hypothetical protein
VTDADDPTSADRLLNSLAGAFANLGTNNGAFGGGQVALALNPDHAGALAAAGHTRQSIAGALCERAVNTAATRAGSAAGGRASSDPQRRYPCFTSPDDILVFVAGGGGLYSAAFPSWCAGPHRNRAVTVEIEIDQACEIPGASSSRSA